MKRRNFIERCAKCNMEDAVLHRCEGSYICDPCLVAGRDGRDDTTKLLRKLRHSKPTGPEKANNSDLAVTQPPEHQAITNDLARMIETDADAHRWDLLDKLGTDCLAMAVNLANSIKAENSQEMMLCDQLAVAHKTALELVDKGMLEADSIERARTVGVAVKFMDVFQRGLLALQRARTGGEQRITIHHVNVGEGGQAIVGGVQTGGVSK